MGGNRRGRILVGAAGLSLLAAAAQARDAPLDLAIPRQPRDSALMALSLRSGISLGFVPGVRCDGEAGVTGRLTVDAALERLLAGSNCEAARPDPRTIVIRHAARLISPPAFAPGPQPGAAPVAQLGELVVTAEKSENLLSSTASSLTAASGPELERQGVNDTGDLSLIAAGVAITNLGPGRDKILLRGLSDGPLTGHTQSTVGLYLGELRLTYNAPDPDLPLIDIARIEVLRGPQGSLYGAGSIGGILQIVPNPPDLRRRDGRITGGLATTAGGLSTDLSATFNQPFAGGAAAVRLVSWRQDETGFIDNVRTGRKDIDRSHRKGLRAAIRWRVSDTLTLDSSVTQQDITNRDAHYAQPAVGALARSTTLAAPHDNDFLAVAIAADWRPAWAHVTLSLGALDHDVTTSYDAALAPLVLVPVNAHPALFRDGNEIRGVVGEVRARSVGGGRLRGVVGLFAAFGDQRLNGVIIPVEAVDGYREARRDQLRETAVFGEVSYDLGDDITLTAGGRLFQSRLATGSQITLSGPLRTFHAHTSQAGFAPKLLAAWRPLDGLTLYAQAAEGYRTAGFNTGGPAGQLFSSASGAQPLRRYGGDELWSYETGLRWRDPARGLTARLAAFQADWTDIQADLILPSGLPFTATLGDGRSRGVEAEVGARRGPWSITANAVWQNPELRRPAPGLTLRGDTGLPGVPNLTYAATTAYAAPLGADWTLDLSAAWSYVGHSHLNFGAGPAANMGGYGDVRLAAVLRQGTFSTRLYVENALDRRRDTLAFGNPFAYPLESETTPQRPRTMGLALSQAF